MKKISILFFLFKTLHLFSQNSLSTSLTACYALNGNLNEPINNLTGTLSAVTPTIDRFNNANSAYRFAGNIGSYIELPNNPLIKPNAISFSAWVKTNVTNLSQYVVFTNNTCNSFYEGYVCAFVNIGANAYRFQAVKSNNTCSGGGQIVLNGNTNTITANNWYHVGFYMGPDSIKLYLNGVLDGGIANSNPINYNPIKNVYLGGTNMSPNLPFNGSMDNIRFYNRKLSGTEFNQLYTQDPSCISQAIGLAPVVSFSVSAINVCAGNSINMTDVSSNNPTAWNWQIPGANPPSASVSNPTISFPTPGNYIISLISSNNVGASNTGTQSIVVLPIPNVIAIANNTAVCLGQSTNLFASGASSYTWSTQQSGISISVNPIINTTYSLIGIDNNGCTNMATVSVNVNQLPVLSIQANSLSICSGSSVSLLSSGAGTYTWSNGQTGALLVTNPSASTIFSVTGTNMNGCSATANISITVNPLPSITINANKTTICKGTSVILTALGALTYTWNNNQNGSVINLIPLNSSSYSVIGTNNNGCNNSSAITIFVDNCVSLKELNDKAFITIFPNPSNGNFELHLSKGKSGEIIILNTLSEIIYQYHFENEEFLKLDLSNQSNGIYLLNILEVDNQMNYKIIKNDL
jgi:hypothetical protein